MQVHNYKDENEYPLERLLAIVENVKEELNYFKIEYNGYTQHSYDLRDSLGRAGDFDTLREAIIAIILRRENEANKTEIEKLSTP